MRTLVVSPEMFLREGGIARIMRLYLKALCENAAPAETVDSLVLNDRPGFDARLTRYATTALGEHVGCGRSRGRFLAEFLRLGRRADRLVCGHLHLLPFAWLLRTVRPDLRYSLVAHGIEVWRPYSLLERRALLGADRILCISDYTRRQLLRFLPALRPERLLILPNTLDPFLAGSGAPVATAPAGERPRLLCVSRLSAADSYKGVDHLIEALPRLRREHPGATLRIVGEGDDQPRLAALAARRGVADAVRFLGAIDDESLRAEYAGCDLFALPSRREGFGLVYLEAMIHGKPCLGARAGGTPEVITPATGALADYGDPAGLAAALDDLRLHPRDSEVVRAHAETFAFPAFRRRLAATLA